MGPTLASWLILLASFVNFLRYNNYPLLRAEVALIVLGMLVLAAAVGFVHRRERRIGKALLDAVLVYFVVDQNGGFAISAGAAAIVGLYAFWRGRSLLPLLGVMAAVMLVTGLLGIGQQHRVEGETIQSVPRLQPGRARPPALLHVILDEHLGIEGFGSVDPQARKVKDELKAFYATRGFRLYGRAYSQQLHTVNAIPQILNFGMVQAAANDPFEGRTVNRNAYFDALAGEGYRLKVYQSDFLNYCEHKAVVRCVRYDSTSLDAVADARLSTGNRVAILLTRFTLLSNFADGISRLYIQIFDNLRAKGYDPTDLGLSVKGKTSALNAVDAFDGMIADLRKAQPGEAYFAHMLLPHYPYAVDEACRPLPYMEWQARRGRTSMAQRQKGYADQIRCAMRKMDAAYNALSASPAGQNFIVVVHGDHGSRITEVDPNHPNIGKYGRSDLIAGFTTLFAVRAPEITVGYETMPVPVPVLLKDLTQSGFTTAPQPVSEKQEVILDDLGWQPRSRAPFLDNW
jgi:hypothetical protein